LHFSSPKAPVDEAITAEHQQRVAQQLKRYLSLQAHLTAFVQIHFACWAAGVAARV